MFASTGSYKFSVFAAAFRLAKVAIISSAIFFTVAASATSISITEELKDSKGHSAELTLEIPATEDDVQEVINDAVIASRTADGIIVEYDVTPKAVANALIEAGASTAEPLDNSILVERRAPYSAATQGKVEAKREPKNKIHGAIFALVKTGIASYVYLTINHLEFQPAMLAITTSLVLNLVSDTSYKVDDYLFSPIKRGVAWVAKAFGLTPLTPRRQRLTELAIDTTATFFLSTIFQSIFAGELLGNHFQDLFFTWKTFGTVVGGTAAQVALSSPWKIGLQNLKNSGRKKLNSDQQQFRDGLRASIAAALSAFSQAHARYAPYTSTGVFLVGLSVLIRSFSHNEKVIEMRDAQLRRAQDILQKLGIDCRNLLTPPTRLRRRNTNRRDLNDNAA